MKRDPSFSMGTEKRDQALNKTQVIVPGPGQYNSIDNVNNVLTSAPKFGFGSGKREDVIMRAKKQSGPGPGNYEPVPKMGKEGR